MNYLVVGGTSGIGLNIVKELIHKNHKVYVVARSKRDLPIEAEFLQLDIEESVTDLDSFLPNQLDGFVYCPGTINLKSFNRLTIDDFKKDFSINVLGVIKITQIVLPKLKQSLSASIVFFSTVATKVGMSFHTSVATSKSALEGFSLSLAAELAPSKIRVNVISPSLTNTPLAESLLSSPEKIEASNKRHPLGRVGEVEDISNMTCFLLDNQNNWITGQIFNIDGGLSKIKM